MWTGSVRNVFVFPLSVWCREEKGERWRRCELFIIRWKLDRKKESIVIKKLLCSSFLKTAIGIAVQHFVFRRYLLTLNVVMARIHSSPFSKKPSTLEADTKWLPRNKETGSEGLLVAGLLGKLYVRKGWNHISEDSKVLKNKHNDADESLTGFHFRNPMLTFWSRYFLIVRVRVRVNLVIIAWSIIVWDILLQVHSNILWTFVTVSKPHSSIFSY